MLTPLFFFQPILILGLFFVAVVQCLLMLVPSMVISPPGRSGKWRPWHQVRTLFAPHLQDRVFFLLLLFFLFFLCGSTNSIFKHCSLLFVFKPIAVFYLATAFNGNLSTWQVGEVTNMAYSTYIHSFLPLSKIGSFFGFFYLLFFYFPSSFSGSTNSIFEQNFLLIFFQSHFYPWPFLCCCGAVFNGAAAFNGDLSTWQVGKVSNMQYSTYTLPPFLRLVFFLAASIFPSSFWVGTNFIFDNALSSFFYPPIFILGLCGV